MNDPQNEYHSVGVAGIGAITSLGDYTRQNGWTSRDFSPHINDFALSNYLSTPKTYLDRASALSLAACALALRDAGLEQVDGAQSGIMLGTRSGCLQTMRAFWDALAEKGARLAPPLLFSHSMLNAPTSLCAIEWGLLGPHQTLCAGERSGLEAVHAAFDALRLGRAAMMLCGGMEALSPAHELLEGDVARTEAACVFVLQHDNNGDLPRISDELLSQASANLDVARERFGHCGGAVGALAMLSVLESA